MSGSPARPAGSLLPTAKLPPCWCTATTAGQGGGPAGVRYRAGTRSPAAAVRTTGRIRTPSRSATAGPGAPSGSVVKGRVIPIRCWTSVRDVQHLIGITRPLTTLPDGAPGPAVAERDGVLIRPLVLTTAAGDRVPALYLTPNGRPPWPAVVAVHQHGGNFAVGKSEPAGHGGGPS